MDRFGASKTLIVVTFLAFLGQLIMAVASEYQSYTIMLLGRIVFGMGCETLMLVQIVDISFWFISDEFTLAVGISQLVSNSFIYVSS